MKTRLLTSLYITIILAVVFVTRIFTPYLLDLLIGVLAVAGVVEISRTIERFKKYNNTMIAATYPAVFYILLLFGIRNGYTILFFLVSALVLVVVYFLLVFIITLLNKTTTKREMLRYQISVSQFRYALDKAKNTLFLLVYPSVFFILLLMLNHIAEFEIVRNVAVIKEHYFFNFDMFVVLAVFLITVTTDSLAMITGMIFKGRKIFPRISPKKTISGSIGGLFGAVLSAVLLFYVFSTSSVFVSQVSSFLSLGKVIMLGLVSGLFCEAGDLLASYIKRKARVKDYGTVFPGHGGVMDRVDGLISVAFSVFMIIMMFVINV